MYPGPGNAARSVAVGPVPQYLRIIAVDVGLHQASPPPSYSGNSPRWVSWEYWRTALSEAAPPKALGMSYFAAAEVIAPTIHTVGVAVPLARYSVTRRRYESSGAAFLSRMNVSMATKPSMSPCPLS